MVPGAGPETRRAEQEARAGGRALQVAGVRRAPRPRPRAASGLERSRCAGRRSLQQRVLGRSPGRLVEECLGLALHLRRAWRQQHLQHCLQSQQLCRAQGHLAQGLQERFWPRRGSCQGAQRARGRGPQLLRALEEPGERRLQRRRQRPQRGARPCQQGLQCREEPCLDLRVPGLLYERPQQWPCALDRLRLQHGAAGSL
mmetsp:Transcript_45593/g.145472  ORF Transcript_45593/g.145472 Transcript_45593/m.145472 type:complete len:200 (-) Transcript_45593:395-994(-)